MEQARGRTDRRGMRSVIGICIAMGSIVGSYVPELWGASDFSVTSLVFGALGGVAGLWVALRLQE